MAFAPVLSQGTAAPAESTKTSDASSQPSVTALSTTSAIPTPAFTPAARSGKTHTPTQTQVPAAVPRTAAAGISSTMAKPPHTTAYTPPVLTPVTGDTSASNVIVPVKTTAAPSVATQPASPAASDVSEQTILPFTAQVVPFEYSGSAMNETSKWTGADGQWEVSLDEATSTSLTFNPIAPGPCTKTSFGCGEVGRPFLNFETLPYASPNISTVLPLNLNLDNSGRYTEGVTAPAWVFAKVYNAVENAADPTTTKLDSKYQISSMLKAAIGSNLYEYEGNFALITVKNGKITGIN